MNDKLSPNSDSTIELIILQERLRQARQSFNLALVTTTSCILISFAGVGLVLLGKANEGTITATGGLASTGYCLKLSKDANDRLDEIGEELRIEN
ncbi:MAG: hypothetical protein F6K47_01055 [Symploca sp. SIO2E6]|nr:hypothetical protein [Symploca sp. SIO2E6]